MSWNVKTKIFKIISLKFDNENYDAFNKITTRECTDQRNKIIITNESLHKI